MVSFVINYGKEILSNCLTIIHREHITRTFEWSFKTIIDSSVVGIVVREY